MWIQYVPQDFKLVLINVPCIGAEKIVLWVYIIQISIIEIIININSDNWLKFNLLF